MQKLLYLSNSWRSLDLPQINYEIELDLKWERNYVTAEISRTFRVVNPNADPLELRVATQTTSAKFQTNNAKLHVPVVTLSSDNNTKFLKNIKQEFKSTTHLVANIDLKYQHKQKTIIQII